MIANTFYRRGIIEGWDSGTLKMADIASDAGLLPLEIESNSMGVTVRFQHGKPVPKRLRQNEPSELRQEILAVMDNAESLALQDILARIDVVPANGRCARYWRL